jgi:outer membrane protein assembly factor BamE (lipoprotein component of BamABCDE complex)
MNNRLSFLLLLCCVLTPSCFINRERVNQAIDQKAYARLEAGVSTADDVLRELGAPTEVVQLAKRSAWRYDFTLKKGAAFWPIILVFVNTEARQDRVWAFFDEAGLLTHVGASFEADKASYAMPWSD